MIPLSNEEKRALREEMQSAAEKMDEALDKGILAECLDDESPSQIPRSRDST